jgi:hypothetical protein
MRITIKQISSWLLLVLGLVSIFLAEPNPAMSEPTIGSWPPPRDKREPCREPGGTTDNITVEDLLEDLNYDDALSKRPNIIGFRCHDRRTGRTHEERNYADPKTGTLTITYDYFERSLTDPYDVIDKYDAHFFLRTLTWTDKDGSQHVEQSGRGGNTQHVADYYPGKVLKYSMNTAEDGTVSENSYYPNGQMQSEKTVQRDDSYKFTSYDADGHRTSEETYDPKTGMVHTSYYGPDEVKQSEVIANRERGTSATVEYLEGKPIGVPVPTGLVHGSVHGKDHGPGVTDWVTPTKAQPNPDDLTNYGGVAAPTKPFTGVLGQIGMPAPPNGRIGGLKPLELGPARGAIDPSALGLPNPVGQLKPQPSQSNQPGKSTGPVVPLGGTGGIGLSKPISKSNQPGKSTSSGIPPGGIGGIGLSKPIGQTQSVPKKRFDPVKKLGAKPPSKAASSPASGGFVQPK